MSYGCSFNVLFSDDDQFCPKYKISVRNKKTSRSKVQSQIATTLYVLVKNYTQEDNVY